MESTQVGAAFQAVTLGLPFHLYLAHPFTHGFRVLCCYVARGPYGLRAYRPVLWWGHRDGGDASPMGTGPVETCKAVATRVTKVLTAP